jgi:tetratricopeptide (TPR) repeat protein
MKSMMFLLPFFLSLQANPAPKQENSDRFNKKSSRIFKFEKKVGTRFYVSANRSGVTAWSALRELEILGAFRLNLELRELRTLLEKESVTLSFDTQEAVSVAELIAVSSGLDLVTERLSTPMGMKGLGPLVATVVSPPSPITDAGRKRLRHWGLRWYRNLMTSKLRINKETSNAEARVHIDMALLLMESKQLLAAAKEFKEFAKLSPEHPFVPQALYKEALCYFELEQFQACIDRSRQVMSTWKDLEIGAKASVLMAKAYVKESRNLFQEKRKGDAILRLDEMVHRLELFLDGFQDRKTFPELLIWVAEGHRLRGRPDQVRSKMIQLEQLIDPIFLPNELWLSFQFLSGYSDIETGKGEDVERGEVKLWQFIRKAPGDIRVPVAWLTMAKAEYALEDPLQALFAVRNAASSKGLLPSERFAAEVFEARLLLSLGKRDEAFRKLLSQVKKVGANQVPELTLFLGEKLLESRQAEKTKALVTPLLGRKSSVGDRARSLYVRSEALQKNHARVVALIRRFSPLTKDKDIQAQFSDIAGDAYLALGRKREAAAAFSGRVQ